MLDNFLHGFIAGIESGVFIGLSVWLINLIHRMII